MKRLTVSVLIALLALGGLALLAWEPVIVAAQEPISVRYGSTTGTLIPEGEWHHTSSTGDSSLSSQYYILGGPGNIYIEFSISGAGSTSSGFFNSNPGAYIDFGYQTAYPGHIITYVNVSGVSVGTGYNIGPFTVDEVNEKFLCGASKSNGITAYECTASGSGIVAFSYLNNGFKSLTLRVADSAYFNTEYGNIAFRWFLEEPDNFCPDGTEALSGDPVDIPIGYSWQLSTTTALDSWAVRYLITRTSEIAPSYVHGRAYAGPVSVVDFNQYAVPVTVTVPLSYGVPGPNVNLRVDNTGSAGADSDFTLLSACIIPAQESPYCPNGIELVPQSEPLDVLERWSTVVDTGFDFMNVTAHIGTGGGLPSAYFNANNEQWVMYTNPPAGDVISWTIPTPPAQAIFGPDLSVSLTNGGPSEFDLLSVCVEEVEVLLAPAQCNLYNHDLLTNTLGFDGAAGTFTWVPEGNGAGELALSGIPDFALVHQDFVDYGYDPLDGPYRVMARVRGVLSDTTISLYLQDETLNNYYEVYTTTVGTEFTTIQADFYALDATRFQAQTSYGDAVFDWFCILPLSGIDGGNWLPRVPACIFPDFSDHPEFSITDLLFADPSSNWFWWLATKLGELAEWVVCMFERAILLATRMILDLIRRMGISIPNLDDLNLAGFFQWLSETIRAIILWLVESWSNILQSLLFSGSNFGEWLRNQLVTFAEWLWYDILLAIISWFMDQAVAAGLIGEDAVDRILWMFRNGDIWMQAVADEVIFEIQSAGMLFSDIVTIFSVLLEGLSSGLQGDDVLDMGEDLGGFAAYLWRGVQFINEIVAATPLAGLNVVALGIITWGLGTWTVHRFGKMLQKLH